MRKPNNISPSNMQQAHTLAVVAAAAMLDLHGPITTLRGVGQEKGIVGVTHPISRAFGQASLIDSPDRRADHHQT